MRLKLALLGAIFTTLTACQQPLESSNADLQGKNDAYGCPYHPSVPGKNEASFCSSVASFSDAVTVTGQAVYTKRDITSSGLGAVGSTQYPIRRAEIAIIDSSGTVIQCGETDATGNFSISVPRGSDSLFVEVRSRANNSHYKASILNNHGDVDYYSIQTKFTPTSSASVGTMVATGGSSGSGSELAGLEGGAFYILDNVLDANEFLRTNAGSCGTNYSSIGCSDFDVAPLVHIYWQPGCNPLKYYDQNSTSGVSFFMSDTNRLYILGGNNGDVNTADTDHFDPVILLHEYGHFLESVYSGSDSPGGSHDGNTIIDPRLAWSEAWASFFASAVRNVGEYVDTYGNSDGTTGFFYKYDAESNSTGSGTLDPRESYTVPDGEGTFREMGLLRALWDAIDLDASDVDNDGVEASFEELWAVFSGASGIKNSNYNFINAGLFFELHDGLSSHTDLSSIFTDEKLRANRSDYALPVSTSNGTCAATSITPANANNFNENGSLSNSNLHASNDFYSLSVSSQTSTTISLDVVSGDGDLDLYIYQEDYYFGAGSTVVAYSNSSVAGATGDESVSVTLPAGNYLINVNSYAVSPSFESNTYTLSLGGSQLCP